MRTPPPRVALCAALALAAPAALAQTAAPAEAPAPGALPEIARPRWDHAGQFGLRAGLSEVYRFVVRYGDRNEPDPCDAGDNKFCADLTPLMLDTALGFGVARALELEAQFRLGLTTEFDGWRPVQFGLGLRTFGDGDSKLKFVLGAAALVELTGARPRAGGALDLILRGSLGLQYDVTRWFGFYTGATATFGVLRNFSGAIELIAGVQFRAPP